VRRLLIEETLPIEKELYLGILVDRAEGKPVFMASAAGGMEIEQVAAENPDAILKQHLDPGIRGDRRPRAARRARRGLARAVARRLLRGDLEDERVRGDDVRDSLVRRHARALL